MARSLGSSKTAPPAADRIPAAQKTQCPNGSRHRDRMAAAKENAIAANERMALPPFNLLPLYQSRPLITRAVADGGKKTAPPLWQKKELMHEKSLAEFAARSRL